MRVLVNSLSIGSLSGRHVLYGHLRQLARWTETQHEFVVLTAAGETQPRDLALSNVEWQAAPRWSAHWATRTAWEIWALPRLIRRNKIDLYFTPNGTIQLRSPVPQISLAQNPWPLVTSIHRNRLERFKSRLQRVAFRHAQLRADLMVFNSQHIQDLYRQNAGGRNGGRHLIAHQGINEATHAHAARTASDPKDPWTILSVSAMAHWKGAEVLVRALEIVRRDVPATLRLVGPWPDRHYENRVRTEIESRGLSQPVVITGQVSDSQLHREYATARVFCLMSQCESFGIPAVEAQVHGVPVVGSSICAIPEICGLGGVYCRPDEPQAVAQHLLRLLTDSAHWNSVSALARQNAAQYRWETCSRPLMEMFSIAP